MCTMQGVAMPPLERLRSVRCTERLTRMTDSAAERAPGKPWQGTAMGAAGTPGSDGVTTNSCRVRW